MVQPDLDLRAVRYFVCVAEQQSFTRAAAVLRVSQPSLSRQMHALERQIGVRLFDRTPQGARLTSPGECFLHRARGVLRGAREAIAAVHGAADAITVGYSPGLDISAAVRELREQSPHAAVRTVYLGWHRTTEPLRTGEVDAVVARRPMPTEGLSVENLYVEPLMIALSREHPLASCTSLTLEQIADVPLPDLSGADDACRDFWRLEPRPDGRPAPDGPAMAALDDAWQMIAQGDVAAVVTSGQARTAGADIALVPLADAQPCDVAVAIRAGEQSALVKKFRGCAHRTLAGRA